MGPRTEPSRIYRFKISSRLGIEPFEISRHKISRGFLIEQSYSYLCHRSFSHKHHSRLSPFDLLQKKVEGKGKMGEDGGRKMRIEEEGGGKKRRRQQGGRERTRRRMGEDEKRREGSLATSGKTSEERRKRRKSMDGERKT